MAIEQLDLNDFSGGVGYDRLAATDFTERQWAQLEGFVLENPQQIRAQWGLQQISADANLVWAVQYVGRSQRYIIAMDVLGQVKYMQQPPSQNSAATTAALTWTNLGTPVNTSLRPLCVVPVMRAGTWQGGWLLNSITLNGSTDSNYIVVQDEATTALEFVAYTDHYPSMTAEVPNANKMPLAAVGTMWNDFLVLGDIEYYDDDTAPLTYANSMRHRNALWISQGGDVTAYDTQDVVRLSDPELNITSLVAIDEGLLILTDAGPSNNGGVYILRGVPGDDTFELEPLRLGMGAEANPDFWPQTGAACFISSAGEVWHTDGREFNRLDRDHFALPRTVDDRDFVSAYNSWLVVGKQGKMFCLAMFEDDAAWTTLIPPESGYAIFRHHAGQSLYMVMEVTAGAGQGKLYRWNQYVDEALPNTSERGKIGGVLTTLTAATRTLDNGSHEKTHWHRVGFRGRGRDDDAGIFDITLYDGPALDGAANSLQRDLRTGAAAMPLDKRFDIIVRAHGPTPETAVKATFEGDVELESVTVYHHRGSTRR